VSGSLTLIIGRMRKRATGMHRGKDSPGYHEATALAESHHEDMARLGIEDGGQVVQHSTEGELGQTAPAGSGYCVEGVSLPLRRVISTGYLNDDEVPSRIIEAVA